MNQEEQEEAVLRVQPFPTLIAQALQLTELARKASPGEVQVLAKSVLVFAAMSLECAATSCLELAAIPKGPYGKIERALSVVDKFDMLHWLAVRAPLNRGQRLVQEIDDLISIRNGLVHARVRRESLGVRRAYVVGEQVEAGFNKALWSALRVPKDERSWSSEHAERAITTTVEFLNYFFFEACKIDQKKVTQMLCTSSGDVIFHTPWESHVLSDAVRRLGLSLRFLDF
jgi:hypothetical protein